MQEANYVPRQTNGIIIPKFTPDMTYQVLQAVKKKIIIIKNSDFISVFSK